MWITLFVDKLHSYLEETHICLDSNICLLIQDTVDKKIKPSGDNQETFDSMYLGEKGGFFWCSLSRRDVLLARHAIPPNVGQERVTNP